MTTVNDTINKNHIKFIICVTMSKENVFTKFLVQRLKNFFEPYFKKDFKFDNIQVTLN